LEGVYFIKKSLLIKYKSLKMNIYSLPAIISFTINFSIALIVMLDDAKSSINRWFAGFILSFAIWNLSEVIILNSATMENAMLGAQVLYRIIFLAPAFFLIIAYIFPKSFAPWAHHFLFYLLVFAVPVMILSLSFPDFEITLVPLSKFENIYYYHLQYRNSPLFIALVFISVSYIIWGSLVLSYKIPRLRTTRQKNQARFLLFGILAIATIFITINSMRTILEKRVSFYFLSTMLTFIISLFFFAAILQYRIVRTSRLIRGGITYTISSSFVLIIYFIIVKELSETLARYFQIDSTIFNAVIIATLVILIQPFERRLQRVLDRLLNKSIKNYRHNFYKLSRELLAYMEPQIYFNHIIDFLKENFHCENILVFLYDKSKDKYAEVENKSSLPEIHPQSRFVRQIFHKKMAIEYYDLNQNSINITLRKMIEDEKIRIILPLIFEDSLLAIIMLGRKKFGRDYTEEEIEILSIFSNEIAIAFQRNLMVDDLRRQDQHRFRLQKLAALGQLTAGIAHEIRNPLYTISTSAETMMRKKLSQQDQKELQSYIVDEVSRLNRILQDFLNLSKLRHPQIHRILLQKPVERVLLALETGAPTQIEIRQRATLKDIVVESDEDLLYQIFLNIGLNALEAIKERCEQDKSFTCQEGKIIFSVDKKGPTIMISDNGIGIPEHHAETIYDPFFTTKKTGTGLGLSIVHNIVESLNGKISFQSKPGRTVFYIELPKVFANRKES